MKRSVATFSPSELSELSERDIFCGISQAIETGCLFVQSQSVGCQTVVPNTYLNQAGVEKAKGHP
jgi:hypothetical protein